MAPNEQEDTDERPNMGRGRRELDAEGWRQRAEEFFKEIPPPPIQPLPEKHAFDLSRYKNQLGLTHVEAVQKCAEAIERYDATTCTAHREEIDTLLVFAGLFSAVVTAFTVESYQWLQSDPNDAIIALLSQIAHPGNQTQTLPAPAGLSDATSARINAYWFLALSLSLASALVALLCKQWVREFERRGDRSPELFIRVRQTKLEGFEEWDVASIMAAIPLLLQSALGLFALGLIELLWRLHTAVAIVVLIPTLAALVFYGATTLLPGLQLLCDPCGALIAVSQCPFKSPQALLTWRVFALLWRYWFWPWFIYVPFEFCYKHCIVFFRRVHACVSPDYLTGLHPGILPTVPPGDTSHGRAGHGLWRRLCAPWQYPELKFYEHTTDGPSWFRIRRWWRRHMPSCLQTHNRQEDWAVRFQFMAGTRVPAYRRTSWVVLDREFTKDRDAAYEYMLTVKDNKDVSAQSYLRGLTWLLAQPDHPGLPQWIWLAIWKLANNVQQRPLPLLHDLMHLHGNHPHDLLGKFSQPMTLALSFGVNFGVSPAVMGELFLHVLPYLEPGSAPYIWDMLCERLDAGSDVWRSGLHAILAHLLRTGPSDHGDRPAFLVMVPQTAQPGIAQSTSLNAITPSELACVIALRFRELRLRGGDTVDDYRLSKGLVDTILSWSSVDQRGPDYSGVVKSTFSAFAEDLDRWLEQSAGEKRSECLPNKLFDEQYRSVYYDLLRPARDNLGSSSSHFAAAEARLVRQLSLIAEMKQVREYNPCPGESWGLHTLVMRWPALHDAVFSPPGSTGDTEGDSASISEAGPSSA